jgi:hypothetical protein
MDTSNISGIPLAPQSPSAWAALGLRQDGVSIPFAPTTLARVEARLLGEAGS